MIYSWDTNTLDRTHIMSGHTNRVHYATINPNGDTIVTGAGDETLRFWKVFPEINKKNKDLSELMNLR